MMKAFTRTRESSRGSYIARRRRRRLTIFLIILASLLVLGILGVQLVRRGVLVNLRANHPVAKREILAAWEARSWDEVLTATMSSLELRPLDSFYLGFKGLASFYKAIELPDGKDRTALIDDAVLSLRQALSADADRGRSEVPRAELEYVLGKAYYYKGPSYWDTAVQSLEEALALGYEGEDTREYLALCYEGLGNTEKAIENFEAALMKRRGDLLLVAAAQTYKAAGREDRAETLLLEAVSKSSDVLAREKARFLLAEIYQSRGSRSAAEEQLELILADDPESAEAHYRLGLLYQEGGDPVRARAEWRRAVSIDPMHAASRQKLAEKL